MSETRKPLVHRELTAEEAERLTPDLFPKTNNPNELEAQEKIRMSTTPVLAPAPPPAAPKKFVLPPVVAHILSALAAVGGIATPFLPPHLKIPVLVGAAVVGFFAGQQLPQFSFLAGRPLLTGAFLTVGLALAGLLEQNLELVPEGMPRDVAYLALVALCYLTGKASPQKIGRAVATVALLFLCVLPALAFAQSARSFSEAQALTRAAPTTNSEGMQLGNVSGYRISICADSGQTLSGAGTIDIYWYSYDAALWMRNRDLALNVTASGVRCQVFADNRVAAKLGGRLLPAANAVTVSAGSVTIRVDAWVE